MGGIVYETRLATGDNSKASDDHVRVPDIILSTFLYV